MIVNYTCRATANPRSTLAVVTKDGSLRWGGVFEIGTPQEPVRRAIFLTCRPGEHWQVVPVAIAGSSEYRGLPDFRILGNICPDGVADLFETDAEQLAFLRAAEWDIEPQHGGLGFQLKLAA